MAFNLLSPGVQFSEIDDDTTVVGTAETGGVLAGPFTWGPANLKTLVDSEITLKNTFGEPDNDTSATWFTASSFLQYGNNLSVVRVISADARNAAVINDGVTYVEPTVPGAGYVHVPTLQFSGSSGAAATVVVANGEIVDVIVTSSGEGLSIDSPPSITVIPTGGDIITEEAVLTPVVGLRIQNSNDYTTNFAAGQQTDSGEFAARYPGDLGNGIQCWICDSAEQFALWQYKGLFSNPPGTSAYTAALGGSNDELHLVFVDTLGTITGTPGDVIESYAFVSKASDAQDSQGNSIYYPNVLFSKSSWVYWLDFPTTIPLNNWGSKAKNTVFDTLYVAGTAATSTLEAGVTGILYTARNVGSAGNNITIQYTNLGTNGTSASVSVVGTAINVTLGNSTSGTAGITTANQVVSAINNVPAAAALVIPIVTSSGTGAVYAIGHTPLTSGSNAIQYVTLLEGGNDGNNTVTDGELMLGYDLFNVDDFSFGLILTANYDATVVGYLITEIAEERQDCVVCFSPPQDAVVYNAGNEATDIVAYANTVPYSSYAFMDGNWSQKYDKYNDVYRWVPGNGDTAGLCVYTDQVRDPWFSPAGLNRGNLKGVVSLAWNPKQAYRDVLYQASINPIVSFAGQGPVLFGDKTFVSKPGAFDRINVRRLFIYIEQAISQAAKYTLFELNDDTTRTQFRGLIDPFLRDIEGRRGLYNYLIVCDATNNTPQMIDAHQFEADIYLQPAKSINYIQLNFIATPTGVDFTEIVGQF
jgi:hypothetical protein